MDGIGGYKWDFGRSKDVDQKVLVDGFIWTAAGHTGKFSIPWMLVKDEAMSDNVSVHAIDNQCWWWMPEWQCGWKKSWEDFAKFIVPARITLDVWWHVMLAKKKLLVTIVAALRHSTGNSGRVRLGQYWTLASARTLCLPSIAVQVFHMEPGSLGLRSDSAQ